LKPKNSPTPKSIELTIDSLSYFGGRGVGRHEGCVVFVPNTAPGDRVRAQVQTVKPRFLEATLTEILQPSETRRDPPCPVAGRCGGCSWQHVQYAEQVKQKQVILRHALKKLGPFDLLPLIAAPDEFHYRNRIQLQVQGTQFGFYAKQSQDLVTFSRCWIAEPALNKKLQDLQVDEATFGRRIELAVTPQDEVVLMTRGRDPEVNLFEQVNRAQNEALKKILLSWIGSPPPEWVFDLYAGSGNLTWSLARALRPAAITAIELSRASVSRAQMHADARSVDWKCGDVAKVMSQMKPRSGAGLVVLDPPRQGCTRDVLKAVLRHRPKQILYVSCNPTTFARDAEKLSNSYRLERVQGLDMFPQTEHVELIADFRA